MGVRRWLGLGARGGSQRRADIGVPWLAHEVRTRVRTEEPEGAARERAGAAGVRGAGGGASLLDLAAGEEASVRLLGGGSARRLGRLSAFGLAPGARVRLIQKRPAVVIEVGGTRLALEAEVASAIRVIRAPQAGS